MNKIKQLLTGIGLSETETAIYLCGLGCATIGVNELEKSTGVKRTTIYHALNTLQQKGLVAKKGTASRLVFCMTKPENLERLVTRQISELEQRKGEICEILPLLAQRHGGNEQSKVLVAHYEGIEGVKLVVEEALYAQSRHWDILAPVKNFFSEFDAAYGRYYTETRKARGLTARSLWEYDPERRLLTPEEQRQRNPRFLPEEMRGKFGSVIIIFDNKVALISSLKELSAVLIQSDEMSATMRAMFDGLWVVSREYEKVRPEFQDMD